MLADINVYFQFNPNAKLSLFADDISMVCLGKRFPETSDSAIKNQALGIMDNMSTYLDGLGLQLNRSKTGIMRIGKYSEINFGTDTDPIISKEKLKVLGLRFTNDIFSPEAFEPEINHRVIRLGEFRTCLTNIADMGYLKFRKLLAFLFVYGILNYAFEVIPIQSSTYYNQLNQKLAKIIIDLWDFNPYTGTRHAYAKLFGEAGWMTARNTHYYNILNFANRILINRKPPSLYRELLSIMKYNDGSPFKTCSSCLNSDVKIANQKFELGAYPTIQYSHPVRSKHFFPYCLEEVFKDIPNYILKHLGRDSFKSLIHFELKFRCQHGENKVCAYCNIQQCRPADFLTVKWNPYLVTGYGSMDNQSANFNVSGQVELNDGNEIENEIQNQSQSEIENSVSPKSVSKKCKLQSVSHAIQKNFPYIYDYNQYYNSMIIRAQTHPFKTIPENLRFDFP